MRIRLSRSLLPTSRRRSLNDGRPGGHRKSGLWSLVNIFRHRRLRPPVPDPAEESESLLLPPLVRQRCECAAFAVARILEVDPVMRIDVVERNAITRAQHLHQNPPGRDLLLSRAARDVG